MIVVGSGEIAPHAVSSVGIVVGSGETAPHAVS